MSFSPNREAFKIVSWNLAHRKKGLFPVFRGERKKRKKRKERRKKKEKRRKGEKEKRKKGEERKK